MSPMVDVVGSPLSPDVRVAGRYLLLKQIGVGGMGRVFRARDELLDWDGRRQDPGRW